MKGNEIKNLLNDRYGSELQSCYWRNRSVGLTYWGGGGMGESDEVKTV